ncbi:MAG: YeeE/YedE family protein [Nitriliruptoraceae bacterium]
MSDTTAENIDLATKRNAFDRSQTDQVQLPDPNAPVVFLGGLTALGIAWYALQRYGIERAALFAVGLALGVTLFHARFGFTSAWRQLVSVGQGRGLQAHALMLGTAALLFAPILATGATFFDHTPTGFIAPITLGLLIGSILFGIGMQLGGACASGTLYATGAGHGPVLVTFAAFIGGSILGIRTLHWWFPGGQFGLEFYKPVSLAATRFGYAGGLIITLSALAVVVVVAEVIRRRRNPPPIAPIPTSTGLARIVRGSWPLWVGALVLAGLNAAVLLTTGRPWGITGAFRLWGSKLVAALGGNPSSWPAWQGNPALEASIFLDNTSMTNIGIILGALLAAGVAGTFSFTRKVPRNIVASHTTGGILMGYGAAISFGCNIGAYFSGIASFSLHGWLWGIMALGGTWIGLRLRPLFGLSNPTPTDSVC